MHAILTAVYVSKAKTSTNLSPEKQHPTPRLKETSMWHAFLLWSRSVNLQSKSTVITRWWGFKNPSHQCCKCAVIIYFTSQSTLLHEIQTQSSRTDLNWPWSHRFARNNALQWMLIFLANLYSHQCVNSHAFFLLNLES